LEGSPLGTLFIFSGFIERTLIFEKIKMELIKSSIIYVVWSMKVLLTSITYFLKVMESALISG